LCLFYSIITDEIRFVWNYEHCSTSISSHDYFTNDLLESLTRFLIEHKSKQEIDHRSRFVSHFIIFNIVSFAFVIEARRMSYACMVRWCCQVFLAMHMHTFNNVFTHVYSLFTVHEQCHSNWSIDLWISLYWPREMNTRRDHVIRSTSFNEFICRTMCRVKMISSFFRDKCRQHTWQFSFSLQLEQSTCSHYRYDFYIDVIKIIPVKFFELDWVFMYRFIDRHTYVCYCLLRFTIIVRHNRSTVDRYIST
jgi:hypothetical protein